MKEAFEIESEIVSIIKQWEPKLVSLSEETITHSRNSQNRTIRQVLGHLIDSTSNNIHRIVHLQYQPSPFSFPNYASSGNNDRWISIQNYQNEDWFNMIQLWKYLLLHYSHVVKNVNDDKLDNEWIAGPNRTFTLKAMIIEFLKHFKLHLSEINELVSKSSETRI